MNEQQEDFLKDEFFNCTIRGAFQRAGVYAPQASQNEKKTFRDALRLSLQRVETGYRNPVPEEEHIRNILDLSEKLSTEHAHVLLNGRFRIGIAQKALNLYLKYLWCLGKATTPPHCPFDAVVIAKLRGCDDICWTKLDNDNDYRRLVAAAKIEAGLKSMAQWELETYTG